MLEPWMEEVNQLRSFFNLITCHHIYREANTIVDQLSKAGIDLWMVSFTTAN